MRLDELTEVLPYMPRLTGLFSAEANYIQTATSLQVSAEANVEKLTYERNRLETSAWGYLVAGRQEYALSEYLFYI